jgi:hypothetical protein
MLEAIYPSFILFARKIAAFAAMIELRFFTTYTQITIAAPADIVFHPAAFTKRSLFHHCFGAFIFSDPSLPFEPLNHSFRRLQIMFRLVEIAFIAINSAGTHFQLVRIYPSRDTV